MKRILYIIIFILIFIFSTLIYSRFIGTTKLEINEIVINTNIGNNYDGMKIVHFSDLHYNKIITEERVNELVKEINNTSPDLVLFTGDLIDKESKLTNIDINFLIDKLKSIKAKYGKYAILGDCDYNSIENISNIYIQSEFMLLNNNSTTIYNETNDKLLLIGMGSLIKDDYKLDTSVDYSTYTYKIALIHEPDMIEYLKNNIPDINLILGGHSINGSLNIPFIRNSLLPEGSLKYNKMYYKLDNTYIYVSNGIGVNDINFRLFNRPSFNLYRLNNK